MRRKQVDKYLGELVAVKFDSTWWNEAVQSWVDEEEEYFGVINRCPYPTQEKYYQLDNPKPLPTDNACWGAHRMKSIRRLTEEDFDD